MRTITFLFAFLMIGSLLFSIYFVLTPVFDPSKFTIEPLAICQTSNLKAYFNASLIFGIIFSVSAICFAWLTISSGQKEKE